MGIVFRLHAAECLLHDGIGRSQVAAHHLPAGTSLVAIDTLREARHEVGDRSVVLQRVATLSGHHQCQLSLCLVVGEGCRNAYLPQVGIGDGKSVDRQAADIPNVGGMGVEGGGAHLHQSDGLTLFVDERTGHGIVGSIHAEDVVGILLHEGLHLLHGCLDNLGRLVVIAHEPHLAAFLHPPRRERHRRRLAVHAEVGHVIELVDAEHSAHFQLTTFLVDHHSTGGTDEGLQIAHGFARLADEDAVRRVQEGAVGPECCQREHTFCGILHRRRLCRHATYRHCDGY